ncbi:cation transport protein-domain-containing protein [Leptodontidium sp. MPI-SDFR-AT-0119]|nr:cation transport protein-domain-containing protein [Leptodontidium sp. MPI-SDFR-AT-0119]
MAGPRMRLKFQPFTRPVIRVGRLIRRNLPPLNFITIHYIYFIGMSLVSAIVFWASATPFRSVSFTDSLFLTTSAMTLAGLNTVNLSTLNTFQQFILFFLIIIGSAIFVSAFVVHVRRKAFEIKFKAVVERERQRHQRPRRFSASRPASRSRSTRSERGRVLEEAREEQTSRPYELQLRDSHGQNESLGHEPRADIPGTLSDEATESPNTVKRPPLDGHEDVPDTPHLQDAARKQNRGPGQDHITFVPGTIYRAATTGTETNGIYQHSRLLSMQGVGARSTASLPQWLPSGAAKMRSQSPPAHADSHTDKYFPSSGFIARNSQFYNLGEAERERLGGVEYKAIQLLSVIVPLYFILWQLLGCLGIGAYVANNRADTTRKNGLNPFWVGAFNAVSAFNNSGMSLLDANMVAFQTSIYMLITMGLLILAGNTCYPIFLRLLIWTLLKLIPKNQAWSDDRNTLRFLLDHPRRCYTNLFPSQHTWWLLISIVVLNGIDWIAFEVLNIGNASITALPKGIRVLDGLFQALAVRSGGFYVVPIPSIRISLQVLYVAMMYISVYPVVITMRNSNVYEERSLGIYATDPGYTKTKQRGSFFGVLKRHLTDQGPQPETKGYFVRQQLRAQLAHDLWWIVLAILLIMIIETDQFERNPAAFSVFNVIFEVVSGYGCVGISLGVPNDAYSFCGSWHVLSKLVLCAVMLRGRHRGLPVAIDKAILLPGESQHTAEEEDAQIRLEKSLTRGTVV